MPHPNRYVEALLQEGRKEGRARGEAIGEARGEARALSETIMKVVREKFSAEADIAQSWVESASVEQLKAVVDRFFTATTLAELLGQPES